MKTNSQRLDQEIVKRGLARSRAHAQQLIEEKLVSVNGKVELKSSATVSEEDVIEVKEHQLVGSVSRGVIKLSGALDKLSIDVKGMTVLDVGISTGGFSQVLLERHAKLVVGIEVGHGQLAESLKAETRLKAFENTNIKDVNAEWLTQHDLPEKFDLIVGDVSFISLTQILAVLTPLLEAKGRLLFLVKPQFELEMRKKLNKQGIVKNKAEYLEVEEKIKSAVREAGLLPLEYFESSIAGGDGNREFFVYAKV